MLSSNNKITLRQFQILFLLEAFGTGFVVLPRYAASFVRQDAWALVLLLLLPALLFAVFLGTLAIKFGSENFASYSRRLLGGPIGFVLCALLWLKIIFFAGVSLRIFGWIVQDMLLARTPMFVVFLVLLAVAGYAAYKGIETRARMAEILIVLIVVPLILLGGLALFDVDFGNLQPVFRAEPQYFGLGLFRMLFMFSGLEFCYLAFPYLNRPAEGRKALVQVLILTIVLMGAITAVTVAKFGADNISAQLWPVLQMLDMLNIPGAVIQRNGVFILSFWMICVIVFLSASLFYGATLGKDWLGKGRHGTWVALSMGFVLALALLPLDREKAFWLIDRVFMGVGLFFWLVLPIILLTVHYIRNFFAKNTAKKTATLTALAVLLTGSGCWDKVELEERDFAVAFGLTAEEEAFNFYTISGSGTGSTGGAGGTISEAMANLNARTSRSLFLGHAKTVVLGESILESHLQETLQNLESNTEIDRQIGLLFTHDDISEILAAHPPEENSGYYVINYSPISKKSGYTFYIDMEEILGQLRFTGAALLPVILLDGEVKTENENQDADKEASPQEENEPESESTGKNGKEALLEGSAAIVDYQLAGTLDKNETRGFLWSRSGECEGAVIFDAEIINHTSRLHFTENGDTLQCIIDVRVRADGASSDETSRYENLITSEMLSAIARLQELGADAYNIKTALYRQNPNLYVKYADDWASVFAETEIVPLVRVSFLA